MSLDHDLPPGYALNRFKDNGRWQLRVQFPDGSTTGNVSSIDIAIRKIDAHVADSRKRERDCLCCGEAFVSHGPGHRMCSRCRERKQEWNGV